MAEVRISRAVLIVDDYDQGTGAQGNFRASDAQFIAPRSGRPFYAANEGTALTRLNCFLLSYGLPRLQDQGDKQWKADPEGDGDGRYDIQFIGDSNASPNDNGAFQFDLSIWVETVEASPLKVKAR